MASSNYMDSVDCAVCLDIMRPPIMQCRNGHSYCSVCIEPLSLCPQCRCDVRNDKIRNLTLEQLIQGILKMNLPGPCKNKSLGCRLEIKISDREKHDTECRYRLYKCEGHVFKAWTCSWTGPYDELITHFKNYHEHKTVMEFKTDVSLAINLEQTSKDIQLVDWHQGSNVIFYKHMVDTGRQRIYWAYQLVGNADQAKAFTYEFEIYDTKALRKLKITELMTSVTVDIDEVFNQDNCVSVSFKQARSFMNNDNEIHFRCRIMKNFQPGNNPYQEPNRSPSGPSDGPPHHYPFRNHQNQQYQRSRSQHRNYQPGRNNFGRN